MDYDYDYDAFAHMTDDPQDFYTHGYGGFGYDTSHLPSDEAKSELTNQVERGDLAAVQRIVHTAASISEEEKHRVINHARRWTEVNYRMSGFTKEYEWFDITPLTAAAARHCHEIVQFLLESGADPTLVGCPEEDVHNSALDAAKSGDLAHGAAPGSGRRCIDLLQVANLFWNEAKYSGSNYSRESRQRFTNRPTNKVGLFLALSEIPDISNYPRTCLTPEDLNRLKAKYAKEKRTKKKGKNNAASTSTDIPQEPMREVSSMSNKEIKRELSSYGKDATNYLEKAELVDALIKARRNISMPNNGNGYGEKKSSAKENNNGNNSKEAVKTAHMDQTTASPFGAEDTKSTNEANAIESAMLLLESVPTNLLTPYCNRLQILAHATRELSGAPIYQAVFGDSLLLGHILGFEGSLAYYHKNYDVIVGYESPLPHDWSDKNNEMPGSMGTRLCDLLNYRSGTRTHLLVCKAWNSFVVGDEGLARWKMDSENIVTEKISIAKKAAQDASLSWTARICAWAIANDTDSLKAAFENPGDKSRGIGAALVEQEDENFEPIKPGHPFYQHCYWAIVDEDVYYDDYMYAFTASIAYAAAMAGSIKALLFIESLDVNLWTLTFDQKGGSLVNSLVQLACGNPTLDCIVESISFILSSNEKRRGFGDVMHQRHRGGNGNHLHAAAARGHACLVEALIIGGMQPNRSCERIVKYQSYDDYDNGDYGSYDSFDSEEKYGDPRDKGVKDNPLPIHWAAIRGHETIVDLIHTMNGYDDRVKERGRVKTFNHGRGFGFIKREKGGKDIFVHITNIDDGEPLFDGELVEFTTGQTSRGFQALEVTRVE